MAENTKIEWATHTFNPWMGCTKVSPACKNCYAERDTDKRFGTVQWGPNGTRVLTSDANWNKPLKWNREAEQTGIRPRVFCASLADVFEDWDGPIENHRGQRQFTINGEEFFTEGEYPECRPVTMHDARERLFRLISATPNLDWLLLTKRPANIQRMWPIVTPTPDLILFEGRDEIPRISCSMHFDNIWLGTSVENQEQANKRIPELLKCRNSSPALFLSCEPLLGAVDLRPALWLEDQFFTFRDNRRRDRGIDWVIAGGESGPNARPSHPDWFRSLRDQCQAAGVPFHFKQWGEWGLVGSRGEHCWNPGASVRDLITMDRVGKKAAGRLLDGREWNEFPEVRS